MREELIMKRSMRKLVAKIMLFVLLFQVSVPAVMSKPMEVEAAETLPIVNEAQVTERVKELAKKLGVNNGSLEEGSGVLFTADGKACEIKDDPNSEEDHYDYYMRMLAQKDVKPTHGNCANCENTNVIKSAWFKEKFGYTVDVSKLPGQFTPDSSGGSIGNTCYGFANFALWYIAKADSNSDIYRDRLGTPQMAFTKGNLEKCGVRIGDIIRTSNNHSVMFLSFEANNLIKVLDCNAVGGEQANIAQVKIRKVALDGNLSMGVTRARNYHPDSNTSETPNTETITKPVVQPAIDEKTGLPIVNEVQVRQRINELLTKLAVDSNGNGRKFTANGNTCGHDKNKTCSNCLNTNVIKSQWFRDEFGYTLDVNILPGHYQLDSRGVTYGYTDYGFVNFALWYISKSDSSSDVYRYQLGKCAFTKANMTKLNVKIGDVLCDSKGNSFMYLGNNGNDAIVLDCNYNTDSRNIAQVKVHKMPYDGNVTVAITRSQNYYPDHGGVAAPIIPDSLNAVKCTLYRILKKGCLEMFLLY